MFAVIETKGATHIAIHIPHQGAEKTLPALAAMLEQNAVFIQEGYSDIKTVTPAMSITLGDCFVSTRYNEEEMRVVVPESTHVLSDDFVLASPEVYISNAAGIKKREDENARLRTELAFVKSELEDRNSEVQELRGQISELAGA